MKPSTKQKKYEREIEKITNRWMNKYFNSFEEICPQGSEDYAKCVSIGIMAWLYGLNCGKEIKELEMKE